MEISLGFFPKREAFIIFLMQTFKFIQISIMITRTQYFFYAL